MKLISIIYTVVFFTTFLSCASVNSTRPTQLDLSSISSERLTGEVEFVFNSDSTSAICIGNKKNLGQTFSFFVYSIQKKGSLTTTYNNISIVKWKGNDTIQYKYLKGTVQKDERASEFRVLNLNNDLK